MTDFFNPVRGIPRPAEAPEDPTKKVIRAAAERRAAAARETWERTHTAWLEAQDAKKQAAETERIAARIATLKAEKRAAFAHVGMTDFEFEKMWPHLLRDHQIAEAERDPLEGEKERLRAGGLYTM